MIRLYRWVSHTSCLFATKAVIVAPIARKIDFLVANLQNEGRYTHKTTTHTANKDNFSVMLTMQKYNAVYYIRKLNYSAYYVKLQCVVRSILH